MNMDWMSFILEIFKLTIPALAVFLVSFYNLKQFLENDYQKRSLEFRKLNNTGLQQQKMLAYERMILFLERINPSSLVMRHTTGSLSATALKNDLVNAVQDEFNHNLAQQLYISPQGWTMIKIVKEQVLQVIVESYKSLESNASGVDLSRTILDKMMKQGDNLTDKGIEFLKKEFTLIFD